jgi:hypothetical protein
MKIDELEFNEAKNTMHEEVNKQKTYCKTYRYKFLFTIF